MVGPKLNPLETEISHYLGLPYCLGGKNTWLEITAQAQKIIDRQPESPQKLYNLLKKNDIGIDCSGLAFHLLTFLWPHLKTKLIGTEGKMGVRRLSADLLTSSPNASPVTSYQDIQTGDLIRLANGRHVAFIVDKQGPHIRYVHNSRHTKNRGVHFATITITDPTQTLDKQLWSDLTHDNQSYSTYFNPANGDGIFRLNK